MGAKTEYFSISEITVDQNSTFSQSILFDLKGTVEIQLEVNSINLFNSIFGVDDLGGSHTNIFINLQVISNKIYMKDWLI